MIGFLIICIILLVFMFYRLNKKVSSLLNKVDAQQKRITALEVSGEKIQADTLLQPNVETKIDQSSATETSQTNIDRSLKTLRTYTSVNPQVTVKSDNSINQEEKGTNQSKTIKEKSHGFRKDLFSVESIISKLGIGLLLIGVGYLFKYAYDNGYITPILMIFIGYILGGAFIGIGVKVAKNQRQMLSQVLFGGGIATLYISTFAAYEGYSLINVLLTFVLLFGITFLAFFIALTLNSVAMSIIALLGGLLTPFLVGIDFMGLYGLGIYIFSIACGSSAIYIFKRWRVLQITSIVGVNLVTGLLIYTGNFNLREQIEFSVLLLLLLVVFNGVEYVLYYLGLCLIHETTNKEDLRQQIITQLIITVLPVLTLIQVLNVLDIENEIYGIIFLVVSLVYFLINFILYHKKGQSFFTDTSLSFFGLFMVIALLLAFEGDVVIISILGLSLWFIFLGKRRDLYRIEVMGLIVYAFGYFLAMTSLVFNIWHWQWFSDTTIIEFIVQVVIFIILVLIAWLQKNNIRKVLGGLAFEVYMPLMVMLYVWQEADVEEPIVLLLLIYTLIIWLFVYLYKKFSILSFRSVLIMAMLPLITQMLYSVILAEEGYSNIYYTLIFVFYSIQLYLMSISVLKDEKRNWIVNVKIISYIMFTLVLLFDVSVWLDYYGYGLACIAAFNISMDYLEPEEKPNSIYKIIPIFKGIWLTLFTIFIFLGKWDIEFNIYYFLVDLILLVPGFLVLKNIKKLQPRFIYAIHMVLYIFVIYINLQPLDNGMVTLFFAAYGILSLGLFIVKANRQLVNIPLGLIVITAIRFIFFDLYNIDILWKIITSMVFGVALLILSYGIHPLMKKFEEKL